MEEQGVTVFGRPFDICAVESQEEAILKIRIVDVFA